MTTVETVVADVLHQTPYYSVRIDKHDTGIVEREIVYWTYYIVTNKETGVIEYKTASLPGAIHVCENLSYAMEQRPWEKEEETLPGEIPLALN